MLQLEARASIAEAGKAAAQFQLTQIRQQLAVESRAHEIKLAALTDHIAHQDAVLAGPAKYLGPLESRVDPVSPVQSPRLQSASPISVSITMAGFFVVKKKCRSCFSVAICAIWF